MNGPDTPQEVAQAARAAVLSLALIGVVVLVALAAAALGLRLAGGARVPPVTSRPPPPRLETTPGADLAEADRRGAQRLSTYGWTDRSAGLVHIPIARAMQMRAAQGWADPETAR